MFEYGSRAGFWRLWRMFTERNMPTTVFGVATALQRNPEIVAAMQEAKWDIASHSLKWIEHKDMSEPEERFEIAEAIRVHTEATGARPTGWYTGRSSINTIRLLMEAGGFEYLCDSYADDLPYWIKGPSEPQLIIPYTLDANDMRFVNPQGFGGGDEFFTYLKDSVRCAVCRRRDVAEDDDRGPALPRRRAAWTCGVADAVPRLHREPRARLGADAS